MLEYVEQRRSHLTQIDIPYHNHATEVFRGSPEDEYRAAIEALAPETTFWLFNALWPSSRANRPEALRYFLMRDTALTNLERRYEHPFRTLHVLERFEDLLGHAREARGHDPFWQSAPCWEVRARVAWPAGRRLA